MFMSLCNFHCYSSQCRRRSPEMSKNAHSEGFSASLKALSGKGRRFIITYIGSDSGFLEEGWNVFESKKIGDYHEDTDADCFEEWFSQITSKIELGSVIVNQVVVINDEDSTEKFKVLKWSNMPAVVVWHKSYLLGTLPDIIEIPAAD
ncbi:hypothetical protein Trydic_g2615 [Trypoxylus dichotomus]